jgi:nitrite reductase/ring-hydroxylating ferredoxin subunit
MFIKVARQEDIAPGGIISVNVEGEEIALCNVDGKIFAVSRRCSHANAPLNFGTLHSHIITCPWHFAQFDAREGKALFGPCPRDYGIKKEANGAAAEPDNKNKLSEMFEMKDLQTYTVKVETGDIYVDPIRRSEIQPVLD